MNKIIFTVTLCLSSIPNVPEDEIEFLVASLGIKPESELLIGQDVYSVFRIIDSRKNMLLCCCFWGCFSFKFAPYARYCRSGGQEAEEIGVVRKRSLSLRNCSLGGVLSVLCSEYKSCNSCHQSWPQPRTAVLYTHRQTDRQRESNTRLVAHRYPFKCINLQPTSSWQC